MNYGFVRVGAASPDVALADCNKNAENIIDVINAAYEKKIKILTLPELCITGYTCGDLFFQEILRSNVLSALFKIAHATVGKDMIVAVGLPFMHLSKLYNCAAILFEGKILGIVPKTNLPTYSEFYEQRNFAPAPEQNEKVSVGGEEVVFGNRLLLSCQNIPELVIGTEICEDLWIPESPSLNHVKAGATLILNLSAGDEIIGKADYRRMLVSSHSTKLTCGYCYAGAGYGESTQDLIFSGHCIISEKGAILSESKLFENSLIFADIDVERISGERAKLSTYPQPYGAGFDFVPFEFSDMRFNFERRIEKYPFVPETAEGRADVCEQTLTMQAIGLKRRMEHTHAKTAVIGISGGLDSTLALLAAVKAFDMMKKNREEIIAVTMPCFGTTSRTKSNAMSVCKSLGVTLRTVNIAKSVKQHFSDIGQPIDKYDVTFENSQARERTQVLMDIANMENGLVVGTGDLSELALGWATYNGDHMSMYGVNASVPKTLIRHVVKYAAENAENALLSQTLENILATPVSPELIPPKDGDISQETENIVGPYALHDFFLFYLVRYGFSPNKILFLAENAFKDEFDRETIKGWLTIFIRRFFAQQFKRSCLPDGPKIGTVSLSPRGDWRMPSDAVCREWLEALDR